MGDLRPSESRVDRDQLGSCRSHGIIVRGRQLGILCRPYVRSCLTVTIAGVGVIKKAMDPLIYKSKYKANNTSKIKKFPDYKNFKTPLYKIKTHIR